MFRLTLITLLGGCASSEGSKSGDTVAAIVNPDRPEHYFDMPFPSDDFLDGAMHMDLTGYPEAPSEALAGVVNGWARRIGQTSQGFANNGAVYFRFEAALDLPEVMEGKPDDPVLLIDVDTGELIPLAVHFTEDAAGDPFVADNLLAFAPALGHPPRSGATLAAIVMESAGAEPAADWEAPESALAALEKAGIDGRPAVATVYTTQDAVGELSALYADADDHLAARGGWGDVEWKRIAHLDYVQGQTPSGEDATVVTTTYADGTTSVVHMYANEEAVHSHEMLDEWPMAVFEAQIPVLSYSGLEDRPYMNPGLGHIFDTDRNTGWINFADGLPADEPEDEMMRIIISIPKDDAGEPILNAPVAMYDHGTGGAAINSVQRINMHDNGQAVAARWADAGWAVIGRDAPLYGARYDLIDEGFSGGSLGYYNVVNLPAFRDNQRQTAIDGHVLLEFIKDGLNDSLPAGSVDPSQIRRIGHSLGSVTTNLGVSPEPDEYESIFLSGTGGVLSHYFLDTGLIEDFGNELVDQIFTLFQVDPPDPITAPAVLGAALGIPEESWENVNRLHPAMLLFQWTMDPGDPMSVARSETVPATVFIGIDDRQVPNFTSYALATALPDSQIVTVEATWDYDPHMVLHREVAGHDALSTWLSE